MINTKKFPLPINENILLDLNMISLTVIKTRLKLNRYLMFPMNHKRYFSTDMSKKTLPEMTEIYMIYNYLVKLKNNININDKIRFFSPPKI